MKLHEALESGKPFKTPDMSNYLNNRLPESMTSQWNNNDVVRDDWEVKPGPREWTIYVSPDGLNISQSLRYEPLIPNSSTSLCNAWKQIRVREIIL